MNNSFANNFASQLSSIQPQNVGIWCALKDVSSFFANGTHETVTISWGTNDESDECDMLISDFEMSQIDIDSNYMPNINLPEYIPENTIFLKDNGVPIGILRFMTYETKETRVCNFCSFYISPAYRSKGYGKAMINFLIYYCKTNNYLEIRLGVLEKNKNAKALYEKLGFSSESTNMKLQISQL